MFCEGKACFGELTQSRKQLRRVADNRSWQDRGQFEEEPAATAVSLLVPQVGAHGPLQQQVFDPDAGVIGDQQIGRA